MIDLSMGSPFLIQVPRTCQVVRRPVFIANANEIVPGELVGQSRILYETGSGCGGDGLIKSFLLCISSFGLQQAK
jgi:hypothetical protein